VLMNLIKGRKKKRLGAETVVAGSKLSRAGRDEEQGGTGRRRQAQTPLATRDGIDLKKGPCSEINDALETIREKTAQKTGAKNAVRWGAVNIKTKNEGSVPSAAPGECILGCAG